MNYEQKYKQALSRATFYSGELLTENQRKILVDIFPELKECEDERIRKGIIRNLQYLMDRSEGFVKEDLQERIAWLEKQDEQTTDKVEPKFKVGDWVILNGVVAKILDKQKYGFIGLDIDGKDFFCNYGHTDSMRLWTINDAKDGDILVNSKGNPFIFTGKFTTNYHNPTAYCGIGNENKFIVCALNWRFHWAEKKEVAPATEEQRELLFEKMKQAGYQWDSEKKELKKIESKKLDADKVIEWMRVKAPKWLYDTVYPIRLDVDAEDLIKQFKKDFGL